MAKRLTPAHLRELRALRARCLLIVDFVHEHSGLGALAPEMRNAIENAYAAQSLKGLRTVARDLDEMAEGLSPNVKAQLDHQLEVELGIDAEAERAADLAVFRGMIERGRIRNEREYRMAISFLDRVAATDPVATRLAPLVAVYGTKT